MIYVDVKVKITGFTGQYEWHVYETSNDDRVSYTPVSGSGSLDSQTDYDVVSIRISFSEPDAMSTTKSMFSLSLPNGCKKEIQLTHPLDCGINNVGITSPAQYTYVVSAQGGLPPYTYNFVYDQVKYGRVFQDDPRVLVLEPLHSTNDTQITIGVYVEDQSGCIVYHEEIFDICKPRANDGSMTLTCYPEPVDGVYSKYENYYLTRLVSPCSGVDISWQETLFATSDPDIEIINNNDGTITVLNRKNISRTVNIYYTLKDTSGGYSNQGTITVGITECQTVQTSDTTITAVSTTVQLNANHTVGSDVIIPVEPRVFSNSQVDWSSFTFDNTPLYGSVTFTQNREIVYTISDLTTNQDSPDHITWTLKNMAGGTVTITDAVLRNILPKPVFSTNTVCGVCGETLFNVNPFVGASNYIANTLYITNTSSGVNVTNNGDGTFTIYVKEDAALANNITFNAYNAQGVSADTDGTLGVMNTCAGQANPERLDITCFTNKQFDLDNYMVNGHFLTRTWTEVTQGTNTYTSQGGVINGSTVDFTSIQPGVYEFERSVTQSPPCDTTTDAERITIILEDAPSFVITNKTDLGNGVAQIDYTYTSVLATTINVLVDGADPSWVLQPTFNSGSGTMVFTAMPGSTATFTITIDDVCGGTIVINDSITLS